MKAKIALAGAAGVIALATTLIKPWEGYETTPYRDIVGVWTVCYGSTTDVIPQRRYSDAECQARLDSDIGKHLHGIQQCIHMPLRQNEWAAVLSWAYNVGVSAACNSTLVRRINGGQPGYMWCYDLRKWVYAKKKYSKGLANRREAELAMCLGDVK